MQPGQCRWDWLDFVCAAVISYLVGACFVGTVVFGIGIGRVWAWLWS